MHKADCLFKGGARIELFANLPKKPTSADQLCILNYGQADQDHQMCEKKQQHEKEMPKQTDRRRRKESRYFCKQIKRCKPQKPLLYKKKSEVILCQYNKNMVLYKRKKKIRVKLVCLDK